MTDQLGDVGNNLTNEESKMADQSHPASAPPASAAASSSSPPAPAPSNPGGMASDPTLALANEIITNIKGSADRFKSAVESSPQLKALMDQANQSLATDIASSIKSLVDSEVAKATGGMATAKPSDGKKAA